MKHSCEDFELQMADALTKRLDTKQLAGLQAHLKICAACRASYERLEHVAALLERGSAEDSAPQRKVWERIAQSLAHAGGTPAVRVQPRAIFWAAAALLALATLIFVLMQPGLKRRPDTNVADKNPKPRLELPHVALPTRDATPPTPTTLTTPTTPTTTARSVTRRGNWR